MPFAVRLAFKNSGAEIGFKSGLSNVPEECKPGSNGCLRAAQHTGDKPSAVLTPVEECVVNECGEASKHYTCTVFEYTL